MSLLRARDIIALTGPDHDRRKVCQIHFGRDGSIYFAFPYFNSSEGVIAEARYKEGSSASTLDLKEKGRATSHKVKLSHHPTGDVRFSLTGKTLSTSTRSFPLKTGSGFVVQLNVYDVSALQPFKAPEDGRKRLVLHFRDKEGLNTNIILSAEWYPLSAIEALAGSAGTVGPQVSVHKPHLAGPFSAFLVAQAPDTPFTDHILLVSCGPNNDTLAVAQPLLIAMGGWGPEEPDALGRDASMLVGMYPVTMFGELQKQVGTIDLVPISGAPG